MGQHECLADYVGALEVSKAGRKLAFCDECVRQSDLVVKGGVLNRIHELLSIATWLIVDSQYCGKTHISGYPRMSAPGHFGWLALLGRPVRQISLSKHLWIFLAVYVSRNMFPEFPTKPMLTGFPPLLRAGILT